MSRMAIYRMQLAALPWRLILVLSVLAGLCLGLPGSSGQAGTPVWGQAAWIAPASEQAQGYYRAELFLPSAPRRAWLQLAAPDSVQAWVNGRDLGSHSSTSSTSLVYLDVASLLQPGRNLIAVRVSRKTYPGTASLRARLVWRDDAGNRGEMVSTPGWRTQSFRESQPDRQQTWSDPGFLDSHWPRAVASSGPERLLPATPWISHQVFDALPRGQWINSPAIRMAGASFLHEVELPATPDSALIGVASRMPYTLTINQTRVLTLPAGSEMTVIDARPYLHAGLNRLRVDTSQAGPGAALLVSALAGGHGWESDFSSSGRWQSQDELGQSLPVNVLGGSADLVMEKDKSPRAPRLVFLNQDKPTLLWLRGLLAGSLWALLIFAGFCAVLLAAGLQYSQARRQALRPVLLLGIVMLSALWLLAQDIRLWALPLLSPLPVFLILAGVLALGLLALRELRHD